MPHIGIRNFYFCTKKQTVQKTEGIIMDNSLSRNRTTKENDDKDNKKKSDKVQKIQPKFYNSENNLVLPRTADCYFNWQSQEFGNTTMDTKLKELGYLLSLGFNLKQSINDFKTVQDTYVKSLIPQTFIFYIMYIRYKDYYHFISEILGKLSEYNLIKLFIDELNLVYDPLDHEINCLFLNDEVVINAVEADESKKSEKEKLIGLITSSKMTKDELNKRNR